MNWAAEPVKPQARRQIVFLGSDLHNVRIAVAGSVAQVQPGLT